MTDDLSLALKTLAEVEIATYAAPDARKGGYRSIVVEDRKAWVAVCLLKGAGFRFRPAAVPAADYESAIRPRTAPPAKISV